MRKFRVFLYIIKQGVTGLFKNSFMIFASISVIFVSLFILGSLNLTSLNLQHFMDRLADKPQIKIDLETEVSDDRVSEMERIIKNDPRVESVATISKEKQYELLLEMFKDNLDLLKGYSADLLYVTFEVKLKDASTGDLFAGDMKNLEGVNSVTDILNIVNMFSTVKRGVETGGWIILGVMGVLSVLLAINTIKLTVIARRKELEIMKYIGASDTYTRGPFVIEGMFIGITGAVLAYIIVRYVYGLISGFFMEKTFFNNQIQLINFTTASHNLLIYFILAGVVIGVLSSALAIRKYIKV